MQFVVIDHADVARHDAFIRFIPKVFPGVSFRRWYELGGWTRDYRTFSVIEKTEVIANASLSRMSVIVHGRELIGWQLGAVGVLPEWRGQGLQHPIMRQLLDVPAPGDLVFLFANDDVLDFYPRFGFRRVTETVFGADRALTPSAQRLPQLSHESADDRGLLARVSSQAMPVTSLFGARDYGSVLLWYWTNFHNSCVHYSERDDVIIVAEQKGELLRVLDVLARGIVDLRAYLTGIVTTPVRRLEFGFTPGPWWPDAAPIGTYLESPLFVYGNLAMPDVPFKFPMLAQT